MFYEGKNRIYMAGQAYLLSDAELTRETASSEWANKYLIKNQANGYVLGKFVEVERANNNKHYFRADEIAMTQPTITYAPLNINHDVRNIVGSFIATQMQMPMEADDHPYVEALSAVWKYYFPEAYDVIARHFAENNLYYSMECVPQSLSTIGGPDDAAIYPYEGLVSHNYPRELNERRVDAIILNQPHFVGGALILPPAKPGWSRADIKEISKFMDTQWEQAEALYAGVQELAPSAEAKAWEALVGQLILMAKKGS